MQTHCLNELLLVSKGLRRLTVAYKVIAGNLAYAPTPFAPSLFHFQSHPSVYLYDCQLLLPGKCWEGATQAGGEKKSSGEVKRGGAEGGRRGRFGTVRSDQSFFLHFVCFFHLPLLLCEPNRQAWQKEQMASAIRDRRQHLPAWGPAVAPGETTWMTQGGMQAYGTSARPAPEPGTPPLLHYILPLTQEGQHYALFFPPHLGS